MKKIISIALLGFVCSFGLVLGATEGVVTNSVQPKVLAIGIDKTSINWGTLPYGEAYKLSSTLSPSGLITITNVGTQTAKISLKTDAQTSNVSGTNKWTMSGASAGVNTYKLAYKVDGAYQTPEVVLTPTYQQIVAGATPGGGTTFDFGFAMPTSAASIEAQTFTTSFLVTE